jgi:uncharacterized membrane protein YkoI
MKMLQRLACPLMLGAVVVIVGAPAFAYTGQRYAHEAKITLDQARAKALKAYPGSITDQELEKERGGTGLRYSFDIRRGNAVHEVGIDARTGKLLENSVEGPRAD